MKYILNIFDQKTRLKYILNIFDQKKKTEIYSKYISPKKKDTIYSNIFMIYFFGIFHKNHIYFKYISKYIPNVNWIYLYIDIFIY